MTNNSKVYNIYFVTNYPGHLSDLCPGVIPEIYFELMGPRFAESKTILPYMIFLKEELFND
ncbi:MAG: hypothetical protein DRI65_11445 [Chloroflexota bacterium]|nr:MAG: hypothetical protein DRI65_11445 [Chloroflexota bacterium]